MESNYGILLKTEGPAFGPGVLIRETFQARLAECWAGIGAKASSQSMQLQANEVEGKLLMLLNDYEQHMKLHRIKLNHETLKTIVVAEAGFITSGWLTGLGALPGIAGMVIAPIYSLRQRKVALLQQEQQAPGKEVAYIESAKRTFPQD